MNIESEVIGYDACNSLRYHLKGIYLGNNNALELAMKILFVVHVWDDLIDQDKKLTPIQINTAFRYTIYDIPVNPIMNKELNILWLNCYHQWLAANEMESTGNGLEKAYMLRAAVYNIFLHIACTIGGLEYAEKVSSELYSLYGESFNSYKEEFSHA